MDYPLSGRQTVIAVAAVLGLAVLTFLVKLYRHRKAMMGLVSSSSIVNSCYHSSFFFVPYYFLKHCRLGKSKSLYSLSISAVSI
jgi:hypothetical protein